MRGDPSDNLPNIPGVGEKTAAKWITEFGSLTELVDRVDEVKGKAGDKLREHLGDVLRNRQLTELARDVPLEAGAAGPATGALGPGADPPAVRHAPVPGAARPALHHACRTESPGPLPRPRPRRPAGRGVRGGRRPARPRRTGAWLAEHASGTEGRAGLAASGSWGRGTGRLDGLALATPDGAGAFIDPAALTEEDEQALAAWLADPAQPKALHDAKGPMHALAARGLGWPA